MAETAPRRQQPPAQEVHTTDVFLRLNHVCTALAVAEHVEDCNLEIQHRLGRVNEKRRTGALRLPGQTNSPLCHAATALQ